MTEKIAIYYDKKKHGDLKGMLAKLRASGATSFYDRSESEIARMLLVEALRETLASDKGQTKPEGGAKP